MASTPSASALSAVLRCKRPPASAYRLGLTYGAVQQPLSRADKPTDKPQNRSALWGLILPDARGLDPPGARAFPVHLDRSAKDRGQNRQKYRIKYMSESCFRPKTCEKTSQQLQTQSNRRIPALNVNTSDSNSRRNRNIISSLRFGDSLASFSGHGVVFTVCLNCETDPKVSLLNQPISYHSFSLLKSRLLQITALVSEVVLARLGAVWQKVPVSSNHLTECEKCASECEKKNKPKNSLEPGT